jgi:hypothetical protein
MDHSHVNHRFAAFRQRFVVLAQTTIAAEPGKGSFDDPTFGQNLETGDVVAALDDLQDPVAQFSGPLDQFAGIPPIGPDQLQPREFPDQFGQHQLGPVAVLDIGGMHDEGQDQAQGVYDDVPLATLDLLAGVVAAGPPFSTVFTDWLSMIAAEGLGFRSAWTRTFWRRTS